MGGPTRSIPNLQHPLLDARIYYWMRASNSRYPCSPLDVSDGDAVNHAEGSHIEAPFTASAPLFPPPAPCCRREAARRRWRRGRNRRDAAGAQRLRRAAALPGQVGRAVAGAVSAGFPSASMPIGYNRV